MNNLLDFYKLQIFHDSYIINTKNLTEVDKYFPVHRIILSHKSNVFKTLFETYSKPLAFHSDGKPIYYIGDNISNNNLDYFLQYFYMENAISNYYENIIEDIDTLRCLCDLFERFNIDKYQIYLANAFIKIFNMQPILINSLINISILYNLNTILSDIINKYIHSNEFCLDLQGKYSETIIKLLIEIINNQKLPYNKRLLICYKLGKHKSINNYIRYILFSQINIKFNKISVKKLYDMTPTIYKQAYIVTSSILYQKSLKNYCNNIIIWYPYVIESYSFGKVIDIINIDNNKCKIKLKTITHIGKVGSTEYIIFFTKKNDKLQLMIEFSPIKIIKYIEINDDICEHICETQFSKEDIIKLLDSYCYECFI